MDETENSQTPPRQSHAGAMFFRLLTGGRPVAFNRVFRMRAHSPAGWKHDMGGMKNSDGRRGHEAVGRSRSQRARGIFLKAIAVKMLFGYSDYHYSRNLKRNDGTISSTFSGSQRGGRDDGSYAPGHIP